MTKGRLLTFVLCTLMTVFLLAVMFFSHSGVTETRQNIQRQCETKAAAEITDWSRYKEEHGLIFNESEVSIYVDPIRIKNSFTAEQRKRVEQCQETAQEDRKQSMAMFRKDNKANLLHHTYLKKNDTVVIEVGEGLIANSMDPDETARMRRLIWIHAGRKALGNVGHDASQMVKRYNHRHVILEPVPSYASRLRERFKNFTRITVLNFGLGKKSETIYVKITGVGTSMFSKKPGTVPIYVMNSTEFFIRMGVGVFSVDLLTINCEGCEFDILDSLVSTQMVMYFKNIQFQPHGHLKTLNSKEWTKRYCMIQEDLSRTHRLTYQYKHIWENWRRLDL